MVNLVEEAEEVQVQHQELRLVALLQTLQHRPYRALRVAYTVLLRLQLELPFLLLLLVLARHGWRVHQRLVLLQVLVLLRVVDCFVYDRRADLVDRRPNDISPAHMSAMNCNVVAAVHSLDIVESTAHHTGNCIALFPVCESNLFGVGSADIRYMY